jgi:pilus assembly protein CpaB
VDVLLTTNEVRKDGSDGTITITLLQNIEVLAVDQRLDPAEANSADPDKLKSVTLLVTPDQAAKVDLGMNKGILHLSLRNPKDSADAETRPATMTDLRFRDETPVSAVEVKETKEPAEMAEPPTPTPVVSQYSTIRMLRGEERATVRIEVE